MARAPLNAMLLELPLHLAVLGFAASAMGLSGSHIHQFASLRDKNENQSSFPGFVNIDDNKILNVDLAMLIIGAVQFAFSGVCLVLSCEQLKKRRGEKSGKGTAGWLIVGLIQLTLLGAWTGLTAAYTAYSVQKYYSFTEGPAYAEPFDNTHAAYLRQINSYFQAQTTSSLVFAEPVTFPLGEWDVSTLAQANAVLAGKNYLGNNTYRAAVAIGWFELGTTFLVTVVHFALPFVWKALGLIREPKSDPSSRYNDLM